MENLLCKLINASLVGKPLEFYGVTEHDWQRCFDLAMLQNVLAMTFPAMSALPKEQRPEFTLWSKWMAYAQIIAAHSKHKREVVRKMGGWFAEDGLSMLIIKVFSLAVLYPQPDLRECGDIDIYSVEDYAAVNACFEKHGIEVGKPDGHHVHIKVDGVSIEHHFAFSNSRVRSGLQGPEAELQRLAAIGQRSTSIAGICFPCPTFLALHTGWHAYEHFLQEKIELRHVIDWALALRQLMQEEAEVVGRVKDTSLWGRFADTMTAIALHRFVLPQEWFPAREMEAASHISPEQEEKMWNDIITAPHIAHGDTTFRRRIMIGQRLMKNRWKFREYAEVSAERFLLEEFRGWARSGLKV